ncbi:MAG TPA: rRNA maturation RNase YbeY [Anseongella sp.]
MSRETIHFFSEDSPFRLKGKTKVRQWLKSVAAAENYRIAEISYIFCSDIYLLEMNRSYLDHDTFTDIITFEHTSEQDALAGDIYISVDRFRENAEKFGVSETEEMLRVMVHGVLHLCGYKDKAPEDTVAMRNKEDVYIRLYKSQGA